MFAISLGDEGAELRPLEPWHAGEYLAHMDRGREYIGRYVSLPDRTTDLASTMAFLQTYADKAAADTGRLYGIWSDGVLVGGVLFVAFDVTSGTCEVGCWLEESAVGRGLITRAIRVLIDWAVEQRGMHRVEWIASSANTPSLNVAKRLGMVREGVQRESYPHRGVRHDMEVWSVLAPEWRRQRETTG
ncbi:GNAT family N-acetyltransferase [Streptomyces sp. RPA4-5]|uniref:GNAT family N-acetyltransferase n=1 Tax=Streptomyces TaxID=1883 RepID=UPI00143E68E7|nr:MULTISPECIES: GNAT family protein [Streptomyces]MCX4639030.1 GNAT family N-acetyltransferase [Streptomyces platensis]QIY59354.1 GNAT family N-acetyltransferase [Streptomyces sp. RPA4-5]WJY42604.1 GNAT family protein [Streptomyces sp. P9-2B-2]